MDKLEKAKQVLREYLHENKEQVCKDLEEMRQKSTGEDIYNYLDKLLLYNVRWRSEQLN